MMRRSRRSGGFTLIELLLAIVILLLAATAGVAWVTRSTQHADWSRDKVFARQKALSILAELRAYVEGGDGEIAADLDGFDDGLAVIPTLTIALDPDEPAELRPARARPLGQSPGAAACGAGAAASRFGRSRAS